MKRASRVRLLRCVGLATTAAVLAACSSGPSNSASGGKDPSKPAGSAAAAATVIEHVDAQGAARLLESNQKVVVIDVRTPDEYAGGHIAGAKNINFRSPEFASALGALDRSQTYLVHCAAGGRSTSSLATFEKLGFQKVVHLDGGFSGWAEAGKPVAK